MNMTSTRDQKRILLWAVPRSLSSVMCRVMMNSGLPTQTVFEPYSGAYYFGPERISPRYLAMDPDESLTFAKVKARLELPYEGKELVFVKDMAYSLAGRIQEKWIPKGYMHTFIIRHPRPVVESFFRIIDQAGLPGKYGLKMLRGKEMRHHWNHRKQVNVSEWNYFDKAEAGYQEQAELFRLLQKLGHKIVALDAGDLMDRPEAALMAYCREMGLEFVDSMLEWSPISDAEFEEVFGAWEPAWFGHLRSTRTISRPRHSEVTQKCVDGSNIHAQGNLERAIEIDKIVDECLPYYEELRRLCLQF